MIPKNVNVSGSLSRKRGSIKKDTFQMSKINQSRHIDGDMLSASTQRAIRCYDEGISIRKKRASLGATNQNQPIPSNAVAKYVKKATNAGALTSRVYNGS
jgi:hypothetical protein